MKKKYNLRSIAAEAVYCVLVQGRSLSNTLPTLQETVSDKDRALLQELSFGVLRTLPQLDWYIQQLMTRQLSGKQRILHYLLMIGIYQLIYTRIPSHAALSETVEGASALKYPQFKGLINGVLRQFQRQQTEMLARSANNDSRYLHPDWLLTRIKNAYPVQWETIVEANNQKPPMWLRVNRLHNSRIEYLELLRQAGIDAELHSNHKHAIRLIIPCPVNELPGFDLGWITIQDPSAQECTELLDPQNGEYILDLCAAPGGKTTHILETAPNAHVLSIDIDEQRLTRVTANLQRLKLNAVVKVGDGRTPEMWCNDDIFDRILLDAPCSASGIIRRHPDIKWLRRDCDILQLTQLQAEIIEAIWPRLKKGGVMVYATCSILPEENQKQIKTFLRHHSDALLVETGNYDNPGKQNLPYFNNGDGFFYAKLTKKLN